MNKTQKSNTRQKVELEAINLVENNIGLSWNDISKIEQLGYIHAIDARVITKEEEQFMKDFRNGVS